MHEFSVKMTFPSQALIVFLLCLVELEEACRLALFVRLRHCDLFLLRLFLKLLNTSLVLCIQLLLFLLGYFIPLALMLQLLLLVQKPLICTAVLSVVHCATGVRLKL